MMLLHTFVLPDHRLYVYDDIDPRVLKRGDIHASIGATSQGYYCPGLGCTLTPCHFNNPGANCTNGIKSFIHEQLSSVYPEYFI